MNCEVSPGTIADLRVPSASPSVALLATRVRGISGSSRMANRAIQHHSRGGGSFSHCPPLSSVTQSERRIIRNVSAVSGKTCCLACRLLSVRDSQVHAAIASNEDYLHGICLPRCEFTKRHTIQRTTDKGSSSTVLPRRGNLLESQRQLSLPENRCPLAWT